MAVVPPSWQLVHIFLFIPTSHCPFSIYASLCPFIFVSWAPLPVFQVRRSLSHWIQSPYCFFIGNWLFNFIATVLKNMEQDFEISQPVTEKESTASTTSSTKRFNTNESNELDLEKPKIGINSVVLDIPKNSKNYKWIWLSIYSCRRINKFV